MKFEVYLCVSQLPIKEQRFAVNALLNIIIILMFFFNEKGFFLND